MQKNIQCLVPGQREASVGSGVNVWTPISLPASLTPCVSVCVCALSHFSRVQQVGS